MQRCGAELGSFLSPEVEAAMSRHPDTVKPGCTGSYEQDLAAALRDIRGVADNGKPYSSSELKTVLHCGHAWRVAKRCSAEGAGSKQDGKLPEWTTADSQTADKQGWGLFNFDESRGHGEIQRDDEANRFATDEEAIEFVQQQAKIGDVVAAKALKLHGSPVPDFLGARKLSRHPLSGRYYVYKLKDSTLATAIVGAVAAADARSAAASVLTGEAGLTFRVRNQITAGNIHDIPANGNFRAAMQSEALDYSAEFFRADDLSNDDALQLRRVFMEERVPVFIRPLKKSKDGTTHVVAPKVAPEWWLDDFASLDAAKTFCKQTGLPHEVAPA
jgi:hypothetical protein